ncbi:MAG TPA: transposase [Verrucomicrobiae bacterium]|nr:transposase [Verrucomicrobiae bacterium]
MKTYILREPQAVEPQKPHPSPRSKPAGPVASKGPVLFVGLDVHNDSIAVSLAPSDSTEVRRYGIIGGEHDDVLKLINKLHTAHPGTVLKVCYEAGPRGFALCRCLRGHGVACRLVCPSKIPRKPGERVKTDRRDADDLARLYRAGELTGIYVPEPEDEAMRDLLRARFLSIETAVMFDNMILTFQTN